MKDIFLVDVDDTILDFHGVSALGLKNAFKANGVPFNFEIEKAFRSFNGGLWESLERKEITREELMRERFPRFFQSLGMEGVDGYAVNASFIEYISTHPAYLNGAESFLNELSKLGRIYFVTNGTQEIQKSRFDKINLWDKAEKIFISQEIGYDKPAKEYTKYVVNNIQDFSFEKAVWIGDSLSADIKAANDANVTSIWFNPRQNEVNGRVQPDYIVKNFDEILKILQKINAN